jgi:hypothetical protein
MTKTNNRPFRFLDLPAELRNTIYELAVVHPNTVFIRRSSTTSKPEYEQPIPVLLSTSRQIRHEVQPIYYSQNKFGHIGTHPRKVGFWFSSLGARCMELLRHIRVFESFWTKDEVLEFVATVGGGGRVNAGAMFLPLKLAEGLVWVSAEDLLGSGWIVEDGKWRRAAAGVPDGAIVAQEAKA